MHDASRQSRHPAAVGIPLNRGAEWVPRIQWLALAPLEVAMSAPTAKGEDIEVEVNHGRWVVECPDCHGAQLACRTDRRFMCNECGNVTIGGEWRKVAWPANAQEIEAILSERPRDRNRNWRPGETPAGLRAEAAAMGALERIEGLGR